MARWTGRMFLRTLSRESRGSVSPGLVQPGRYGASWLWGFSWFLWFWLPNYGHSGCHCGLRTCWRGRGVTTAFDHRGSCRIGSAELPACGGVGAGTRLAGYLRVIWHVSLLN